MGSLLRGRLGGRLGGRPLRGVLVAGGKGTRMGQLTAEVPKPMLRLGGRPVLGHLVDQLAAAGIRDVVILAGHLHEVITEHLAELGSGETVPELVVEPRPAGSGGCLRLLGEADATLVVLFGDVMVHMDLGELVAFHRRNAAAATAVVHPNDHPHDSDLAELDAAGRLVALYKKPHLSGLPVPNLVIAGVFVIEPEILARVPADWPADLVHDVLAPAVAEGVAVYGYRTAEYLKDMGTPERFEQVRQDFESGRVARPVLPPA